MIAIINYQRGNLNNVKRAFENFGYETVITETPDNLERYSGVVLPGVGAFGDSMRFLKETGFDRAVIRYVEQNRPFMGICLGLQLLFEKSLEFGEHNGLGIFKGRVVPFEVSLKVPHMGWNSVKLTKQPGIASSLKDGQQYYFVHTYYVVPENKDIILAETEYEVPFVSAIETGKLFACQFHPEKSQTLGLDIIKSFGAYCADHTGH